MEKEKKQAYAARVTQANRSELIIIMYEIILESISDAVDYYENDNKDNFKDSINMAQKFVQELIDTLDFKYEISKELFPLYVFVNKQLIEASVKNNTQALVSAYKVLETLKVGFDNVRDEDKSNSVMTNTETIYAGLTYGKGNLTEMSVGATYNRGFKA